MPNGLPGKSWRSADGLHIDVRGLAPPEPMVAIMARLDSVGPNEAVVVHHFREPVYLYPELAEIGWTHKVVTGEPNEVRLILRRQT